MLRADERKIRAIADAVTFDQRLMESRSSYQRTLLGLRRHFLPYYFVAPPRWRVKLRAASGGQRAIPNFASLGAVRSGTTSLSSYVMQHPCVVLPIAKEFALHYVDTRLIMAQFPTLREMKRVERKYGMAITGFCSPIVPLLGFPVLASAIAPDNPKVVLILRNPVERAFAHYRWDKILLRGADLWKHRPSFAEIVDLELEAIADSSSALGFAISGVGTGYVQASTYLPFVRELVRVFGKENVLLVNASEFFADPVQTTMHVYDFLGLPPYTPVMQPVRNANGKVREAMDNGTEKKLTAFFEPLNAALYAYTGRDFGW